MRGHGLDAIDARIITHLQQDGRRPYTTDRQGPRASPRRACGSASLASLRPQHHPDRGRLEPTRSRPAVGADQHPGAGDQLQQAAEHLAELPEVDFVGICAGRYDLTVGVVCRDREALLELLVDRIRPVPGILETELLLMLKVLKDNYQWSPTAGGRERAGDCRLASRRRPNGTVRRSPCHDSAPGSRERPPVRARQGDHAGHRAHRRRPSQPLRLALPRRLVPRGRRRQPLHRLAQRLGGGAPRRQPSRARRGRPRRAQGVRHRVPFDDERLAPLRARREAHRDRPQAAHQGRLRHHRQ